MKKRTRNGLKTAFLISGAMLIFLIGVLASDQLRKMNKTPERTEGNGGSMVQLSRAIAEDLNTMYEDDMETSSCLIGTMMGNAYVIKELVDNPVLSRGPDFIRIKQCDRNNVLGNVHTHPGGTCSLSLADAYALGKSNQNLTGIICGPDQFAFFSSEDLDNYIPVKVVE